MKIYHRIWVVLGEEALLLFALQFIRVCVSPWSHSALKKKKKKKAGSSTFKHGVMSPSLPVKLSPCEISSWPHITATLLIPFSLWGLGYMYLLKTNFSGKWLDSYGRYWMSLKHGFQIIYTIHKNKHYYSVDLCVIPARSWHCRLV